MSLLDLLFPPHCAGCRRYGAAWCSDCRASIEPLEPGSLSGIPVLAGGRMAGPLQHAIHTYKYHGRRRLAAELSPPLVDVVRGSATVLSALTFVPLHRDRLRERGFNQAELIAGQLARYLGLPLLPGLARLRATPAQVGLRQAERRENLIAAFAWVGAEPPPAGLGVVDDVCTTGATLEAAAEAIRRAGGSVGAYLVLARAQTLAIPAVTSPGQPTCP